MNEAKAKALVDAVENLIIAIGMGWDLDGVVHSATLAVRDFDPTTCLSDPGELPDAEPQS